MNLSIISLLVLTLWVLPLGGQSAAKAGNAGSGKKIYFAVGCYQCHGLQGQGGSAAPAGSYGPRLAPVKLPEAVIRAYLRHPSGNMPPYTAKVLSDSQINDIFAFLMTIPAPPPVKDIPLLNP